MKGCACVQVSGGVGAILFRFRWWPCGVDCCPSYGGRNCGEVGHVVRGGKIGKSGRTAEGIVWPRIQALAGLDRVLSRRKNQKGFIRALEVVPDGVGRAAPRRRPGARQRGGRRWGWPGAAGAYAAAVTGRGDTGETHLIF